MCRVLQRVHLLLYLSITYGNRYDIPSLQTREEKKKQFS